MRASNWAALITGEIGQRAAIDKRSGRDLAQAVEPRGLDIGPHESGCSGIADGRVRPCERVGHGVLARRWPVAVDFVALNRPSDTQGPHARPARKAALVGSPRVVVGSVRCPHTHVRRTAGDPTAIRPPDPRPSPDPSTRAPTATDVVGSRGSCPFRHVEVVAQDSMRSEREPGGSGGGRRTGARDERACGG